MRAPASLSAPEPLRPVRLSDLPLELRLAGARDVAAQLAHLGDALVSLTVAAEVRAAAERPSTRTYWVPASAVAAVLGKTR